MVGDDEFHTYSGLRAAIKMLNSDTSIIGCVGRCLYFFVDQDRFLLRDGYREWKRFTSDAINQNIRLDEDLPPNKTHMAHYAVMRSPIWIQIMENAYSQRFSCAYAYERLVNLQRGIIGRTEILDDLLWFRSMENKSFARQDSSRPDFLTWVRDPKFSDEITQYRQIARRLLIEGGVSSSEARKFEERWFTIAIHSTIHKKSRLRARFRRWFRPRILGLGSARFRLFVKRHVPNQLLGITGWQGYGVDETLEFLRIKSTRFEPDEIALIGDLSLKTARELKSSESSPCVE